MPKKSVIARLPADVRRVLVRKLYARGFGDYAGLANELKEAGHPVSKSALQRFGVKIEARVKQAELDDLLKHNARACSPDAEHPDS